MSPNPECAAAPRRRTSARRPRGCRARTRASARRRRPPASVRRGPPWRASSPAPALASERPAQISPRRRASAPWPPRRRGGWPKCAHATERAPRRRRPRIRSRMRIEGARRNAGSWRAPVVPARGGAAESRRDSTPRRAAAAAQPPGRPRGRPGGCVLVRLREPGARRRKRRTPGECLSRSARARAPRQRGAPR